MILFGSRKETQDRLAIRGNSAIQSMSHNRTAVDELDWATSTARYLSGCPNVANSKICLDRGRRLYVATGVYDGAERTHSANPITGRARQS